MATNKKKTKVRKPSRWWLIPKILMLLGIGGFSAVIVALLVMEQELNRIGFFTRVKLPSFQLPKPLEKDSPAPTLETPLATPPATPSPQVQEPVQPPTQVAGPTTRESAPTRTTEDISHEDKQRLHDLTSSRAKEELSHEDRRQLDDILRTR
jgi:hypothetical protein